MLQSNDSLSDFLKSLDWVPAINIRQPHDRLIFVRGILIPGKMGFIYIETDSYMLAQPLNLVQSIVLLWRLVWSLKTKYVSLCYKYFKVNILPFRH